MTKRRAAIVSPLRTPVGRFQGTLAPLNAGQLGAAILKALVERSGIDPARVDDVVFSQGYGNGEAPCIARWSPACRRRSAIAPRRATSRRRASAASCRFPVRRCPSGRRRGCWRPTCWTRRRCGA